RGALKSWAVPKGVPTEAGVRRLASSTEDHPIDYLEFEGVIPPGQYGGGTVMVWDIGTYEVIEGNYWKGNLHISLKGKKLKGEWSLSRDRVKGTTAQIAAARDATWHSNRTSVPGVNLDALPASDMKFVEPMLAKPISELPEGPNWQYEIKWDGYRALAIKDGSEAALVSRRNNSL